MSRVLRVLAAAGGLGALLVLAVPFAGAASQVRRASGTAPWVLHIQRYPGGISAGVRAMYAAVQKKEALGLATPSFMAGGITSGRDNLQMNIDSNPPMPQDETAVALDSTNPMVAVAAANDYITGGEIVMYTSDGGQHWGNVFVVPEVHWQGLNCGGGGDPAVAYSLRDHAFYLGQLCFSGDGTSEVHVFKSIDGGRTWTPGSQSAVVVSNFDPSSGVDTSLFYDHDFVTVDNSPTSPYFGRVYASYVKFHTQPSGFSDFCPAQIAYTDRIPTNDPSTASWHHTGVVADNPGGPGIGPTANQDAIARTQADGSVDVTYSYEDCNTGLDRHVAFKQSTDGGASFPAHPTRIDKPGQFRDNPNLDDTLPPTAFRAPLGPGFAISPTTGTLAYVYQNNVNRAHTGADISLSLSHDGGKTWSDAKFLSVWTGGGPAGNDQFFPAIAATESGTFYAIWFDRRRDPANTNIDTWEAVSTDDGATWTSRRISSKSWDPNRGFFDCGCFIGDYNQIDASDAVVYPVWTDGRRSAFDRTGIGETDIFTDVEIH
jgi:hypothetical protein